VSATTSAEVSAELLERAVGYTRTCLALVTPDLMGAPTPCAEWDLARLLRHMDDSLAAFAEAAVGRVDPCPPPPLTPEVVASLRARACALLGAWSSDPGRGPVAVAGRPMPRELLAGTGALEIAVHGWDVARACRADRPLPEALARTLLEVAPLVVGDPDRDGRFAAPRAVPEGADAGTRLLAFLGRTA